ncbi:MAG TPA: hypothetical protein VJM53_07010, partial [Burkholderiales bacterium]|nr:hypothetical protein [Burkholderiales bacterium]
FTAENREENEHYYLREDPKDAADKLLEFATAVTMAADAGARLEAMTESLHDFVYAIDQEFPDTTQGLPEKRLIVDERDALFEVRHLALVDWLSLFNETFQGGGGIADEYALRLKEAEGRFENFDRVVAKRKTERMKKHFEEFAGYFENGKQAYEGNKALKHEFFFFRVRDILEQDHKTLTEGFAERVETPLPSGQTLVIDQRKFGWGENLEQAARLELFTKVFGLRSALFYFYAANLSLHQKLIEVDAGSEEFQERVGKELAATRKELQDIFWSDNYDAFLKRTKVYEQQINDLAKEIKERVQIDILKSLAITIVAALVTQGAALAVRLATFSRVVAIMRTARAISTVGTLFEIGVFTAAELSMQKGFMGKQITADKAMKSLANNLIFLGALKIVGAFAKPFGRLAQGSPFRQLFFGHMVGFGGVAGVSATIHKIEKGQWPPDMAAFLVQTAATYVVLAVIHKSFNNLVSKPLLEKAARQRIAEINAKNESLFKYANDTASRGKADKAAAESIRTQRIEAIEETRAIARVLKDGGALNADELTIVEKFADDAVAEAKAWNFPPQTNEVTALPSPESAFGIVRVGDSNTYVYEPSLAKAELAEMLDVYRSKGFTVTGSGGYTLVADTRGRTRFLLSAAPIPDLPALPPGPQGAGAAPIATPSGLKGIELVLVVEEGMDANDVRRKAAALNDLAERGKISKKEETVGTRAVVSGGVGASYMGMPVSVPGEYKYRILDQAHRIFGPQSPNYNPQRWRKFFDLWKKKSGDHVLDLQLTGADEVGNIWLFDLQTNVALGRQIARQLARVPGGTRIEKVTVKTASPALPGDEDED